MSTITAQNTGQQYKEVIREFPIFEAKHKAEREPLQSSDNCLNSDLFFFLKQNILKREHRVFITHQICRLYKRMLSQGLTQKKPVGASCPSAVAGNHSEFMIFLSLKKFYRTHHPQQFCTTRVVHGVIGRSCRRMPDHYIKLWNPQQPATERRSYTSFCGSSGPNPTVQHENIWADGSKNI